jgi:hypothetical protein
LACNLITFLLAVWLETFVPAPVTGWLVALAFLFFLVISLLEIPIMVIGLRKLAADGSTTSLTLLKLTNAFYVFFAAVYAGMFVLLTGRFWAGAGLAALGVFRFLSSLLFVEPTSQETS